MLVLVVVIAILATNLFLGFFIAHFLGYGPQNFHELWTGVYLRPIGPDQGKGLPNPLPPAVLDAMTRAAAAGLRYPNHDSEHFAAETKIADAQLIQIVIESWSALRHSGLALERTRWLEPEGASNQPVIDTGPPSDSRQSATQPLLGGSDPQAVENFLAAWASYLPMLRPELPLQWWSAYLDSWSSVRAAWIEYGRLIVSLRRLEAAERAYELSMSEVVCDNSGCRRVPTTKNQAWWQRSAADIKTLAWAQTQKLRLGQELFEKFVQTRQLEQALLEQVCDWLGETYKAHVFASVAQNLPSYLTDGFWGKPLAEDDKAEGYLVLIGQPVNWVAEYCIGSVFAAAFNQHRSHQLHCWFAELPQLENEHEQPLAQRIDERNIAVWIPTTDAESAGMTAWTIGNRMACPNYLVSRNELKHSCRLLLIPLNPKRTVKEAIRLGRQMLLNTDLPLWESEATPVWHWNGKQLADVPRPVSVPSVNLTVDLAAWYISRMLGETLELSEPSEDAPQTPGGDGDSVVASSTRTSDNSPAEPAELPVEDDGIEW